MFIDCLPLSNPPNLIKSQFFETFHSNRLSNANISCHHESLLFFEKPFCSFMAPMLTFCMHNKFISTTLSPEVITESQRLSHEWRYNDERQVISRTMALISSFQHVMPEFLIDSHSLKLWIDQSFLAGVPSSRKLLAASQCLRS